MGRVHMAPEAPSAIPGGTKEGSEQPERGSQSGGDERLPPDRPLGPRHRLLRAPYSLTCA